MRTTKGWRAKAGRIAAATALMSLSLGGVAVADDIYNNLDGSVDTVAEVMALTVGGAKGTTSLAVVTTESDGKSGCNLTGQTTLVIDLTSSDPTKATVSPSRLTFDSCGAAREITVSPGAKGLTKISATQVSNSSQGSFNLLPATFMVDVTDSDPVNTAPTVDIAGVSAGASYVKGSVPSAKCQVADAEDGDQTLNASLSVVTGPDGATGIGTQTASCSYTDGGNLTVTSSVSYTITDASAPVIGYTLNPATANGDGGWYNSGSVVLDWTVSESDSPSTLLTAGCAEVIVSADQKDTPYTCSASSAGGPAEEQTVWIKRDATAPLVMHAGPATNVWYNADVTANFTATDITSGPETQAGTETSAGEGSAVPVESPAFRDVAGNVSPKGAVTAYYKVDKTAPTNITFTDGPVGDHFFGDVPAKPTCTATDTLSGLADCEVTGYSNSVGSHTLIATATDNAGNTRTAERSYTVQSWTLKGFYAPVDIGKDAKGNPIINTVKAGSTVPLKFEAFKGALELTDVSAVHTFTVQKTGATAGQEDAIETYSTGGTSLRYDATGGQFIQNWQVPKDVVGSTYKVTVTLDDGSTTSAIFRLK